MKKRIGGFLLCFIIIVSTFAPFPFTMAKTEAEIEAEEASRGRELVELTPRVTDEATRYTVLVLDSSSSMSGEPLRKVKETAKIFVEQITNASGDNHVALVEFNHTAIVLSEFVGEEEVKTLNPIIDKIVAMKSTNAADAFIKATDLLDKVRDTTKTNVTYNVIFLSDGYPNDASSGESAALEAMLKGYHLYTLGYAKIADNTREFLQNCQNYGYYAVDDPNDLEFTFGEIADQIKAPKGSFKYASPIEIRDLWDTYYYSNDYFSKPSYTYNEHLATMSLCLGLAAFGSNDEAEYSKKSVNAQNLLRELGFSGIAVDRWFTEKPGTDSIGVIAGSKDVKYNGSMYTLIALAIRGGGYEKEWASNVTLGKSENHKGFLNARDNVVQFLEQYVTHFGITGSVKLWVTGYSRAGAVANLVGASLDNQVYIGDVQTSANDTYVYTFETPQGAVNKDVKNDNYKNIFNIINQNDLVTKVPMKEWNFDRYGTDVYLPSITGYSDYLNKESEMLLYYSEMNRDYRMDEFEWIRTKPLVLNKITVLKTETVASTRNAFIQSDFSDEVLTEFANKVFLSRGTYVMEYEKDLRLAMMVLNASVMPNNVKDIFIKKLFENITNLINRFLVAGAAEVTSDIVSYYVESWGHAEIVPPSDEDIEAAGKTIADIFLMAIRAELFEEMINLVRNIDIIKEAHYPEICLSWLKTQDDYYMQPGTEDEKSKESDRHDGKHRIIHIYCPVDVEAYDSDGKLVLQIIDNVPTDIEGGVMAYVKGDEKVAFLPPDQSYEVKIAATDDGYMTYMATEEDAAASTSLRAVTYSNIELSDGEVFTAYLPEYQSEDYERENEATSYSYTLADSSGQLLTPTHDGDIDEITFDIKSKTSDETLGTAIGNKSMCLGQLATVAAFAAEGALFEGWYEDGEKIEEAGMVYEFNVQGDRELTARFESIGSPTPSLEATPSVAATPSITTTLSVTATPSITATPSTAATGTPTRTPTTTPSKTPTTAPSSSGDSGTGSAQPSSGTVTTPSPTPLADTPAEALHKLGLFAGTGTGADGKPIFDLDKKLTRLESLALVIRLMGLEKEAQAFTGENTFIDVPEWGDRYAAFGYSTGITAGINSEHTLFASDRQVTFQEFTAFLLRVLGYTEANGDFAYEFAIRKADEIKLFTPYELKRISSDNFLRDNAVLEMVDMLETSPKGSANLQIDVLAEKGVFTKAAAKQFLDNMKRLESSGPLS
ncbi:MAG: VWA domain-containing protein [Clostridiales bacterium]|jgi:hypothetical protein|nr:VWA domain-containing protein [Clostridiales bacterium]